MLRDKFELMRMHRNPETREVCAHPQIQSPLNICENISSKREQLKETTSMLRCARPPKCESREKNESKPP